MVGQLLSKQYRFTRLTDNLYRSGQWVILLHTARHTIYQINIPSRGVVVSVAASSHGSRLSNILTMSLPGTNFF